MTTQMYIAKGIDGQVVRSDARKKSIGGEVIVHFHPKYANVAYVGGPFKHQLYENGELTTEWGEVDGTSIASVREGQ